MGNREIERKFRVIDDTFKLEAHSKDRIVQGFLSTVPERTVRVRIAQNKGFITVKGLGNESGTTRFEWEKEIGVLEAEKLLELCEPGKIEKTRYLVRTGQHVFEVDCFEGMNQGLIIAEIELKNEDEPFQTPIWLGQEVTGDKRFYNSALSLKPFTTW